MKLVWPSRTQWLRALALCGAAGALGSLLTISTLSTWWSALDKPTWTPPDLVLLGAPLLLSLVAGVALAFLWAQPSGVTAKKWALRWFWVQLVLGVAWTATFFAWRAPSAGYIVAVAFWLAIIAFAWTSSRVARPAMLALVPMLGWATFISSLNFAILMVNTVKPQIEVMDKMPENQDDFFQIRKQPQGKEGGGPVFGNK